MTLLRARPLLVIGLMLGACCERLAETRHGKQGTGAPDNHRSPAERSDAGVYTGADEVPDSDGGRFSFVPEADVRQFRCPTTAIHDTQQRREKH